MPSENYRFIRLSEYIEIPVPMHSTPEEEEVLVAKFKAEHDLAELENDCRRLAQQIESGQPAEETFPLEDLICELQETQKQFEQTEPV